MPRETKLEKAARKAAIRNQCRPADSPIDVAVHGLGARADNHSPTTPCQIDRVGLPKTDIAEITLAPPAPAGGAFVLRGRNRRSMRPML